MKTYRLLIKPKNSWITPPDADTVFGGLCWTIRYKEGLAKLQDFLNLYLQDAPPVLLSNAYPGDFLPKPLIPVPLPRPDNRAEMIAQAYEAKRIKEIEYLDLREFQALAAGKPINPQTKTNPVKTSVILRNQINRSYGSTADGGELYESIESFLTAETAEDQYFSLYLRIVPGYEEKLISWFELLGETGLGKRKSTGKGAFTIAGLTEYDGFISQDHANAFITLSNFVPASTDPTVGYYRITVKYGKLGEQYALAPNPFKRPLVMIKAGSAFKDARPRPYYGRLVTGIAPAYPQVVQYGFAFAIPALIPEEMTPC